MRASAKKKMSEPRGYRVEGNTPRTMTINHHREANRSQSWKLRLVHQRNAYKRSFPLVASCNDQPAQLMQTINRRVYEFICLLELPGKCTTQRRRLRGGVQGEGCQSCSCKHVYKTPPTLGNHLLLAIKSARHVTPRVHQSDSDFEF